MKVISICDDFCTVELRGIKKTCYIGFLDEKPKEGEYLLVHAGMAIKVINEQEAKDIVDELTLLIDGELKNSG